MKIDGHYQMTKAAIQRVKKNNQAPRSIKVIPTFNSATNAVTRDILDVITLGHWLNGSQKHHFMRRFDGQSEFDAYKEAVAWIRKNVNSAARALAMAVKLGRNPYRRSTIGSHDRQAYLSQVSSGIGYAAHAIQDSFAHGHCERKNLSLGDPGVIIRVKMYAGDDAVGHSDHDKEWKQEINGKTYFSVSGENAVRATAAMVLLVARGASWMLDPKKIAKPDFGVFQGHWLKQQLSKSRDFSYDFIKRFATFGQAGSSAFTITLNMDEEGLAKALYSEVPTDGAKTYSVISRLNEFHNTDVDDVAEIYVNLVRKRGGPARQMLKKNPKLVKLLIRAMDEGWTTDGEQACIDYLKTL